MSSNQQSLDTVEVRTSSLLVPTICLHALRNNQFLKHLSKSVQSALAPSEAASAAPFLGRIRLAARLCAGYSPRVGAIFWRLRISEDRSGRLATPASDMLSYFG